MLQLHPLLDELKETVSKAEVKPVFPANLLVFR